MTQVRLLPPGSLRHIEDFSRKRVAALAAKIQATQTWTKPICVERNYMLVLDGQHRLEVARLLGLQRIPCELYDYADVEVWSLRHNHEVSRELVIQRSISGDIYPYKTAKHKFPRPIRECSFSLAVLRSPE